MLNLRDLRIDPASLGRKMLLEQQYQEIQRKELETWHAFLRRIHSVTEFRRGMPPREVPHEMV